MKNTLRDLVAAGKTAQALESLRGLKLADQDLTNEIVQLSARYAALTQGERLGTLHRADAQVERNQITAALLALIGQLPESTDNQPGSTGNPVGDTTHQQANNLYNIGHINNANFS
ncbi:MAG: hypothetical protein SF053_22495 [Bacteroidia bacterium]|nr:hypothetical protein [Bacteroidia bacterium]